MARTCTAVDRASRADRSPLAPGAVLRASVTLKWALADTPDDENVTNLERQPGSGPGCRANLMKQFTRPSGKDRMSAVCDTDIS